MSCLIILVLDEPVYVRLKPYNSYCVEKLWLGFSTGNRKEGSLDPHQINLMKQVGVITITNNHKTEIDLVISCGAVAESIETVSA